MSLFSLHITGLDALNQRMTDRQTTSSNLGPALRRAGILTQQAAQVRIKRGGDPRWVPSQRAIKTGGTTGYKTGTMYKSIIPGPAQVVGASGSIKVGVSGQAAKYASVFQFGSGSKAGHRNSLRGAARNKALRRQAWMSQGKVYVARSVTIQRKGQPPRPFLYFDDNLRKAIVDVFRRLLQGGQ